MRGVPRRALMSRAGIYFGFSFLGEEEVVLMRGGLDLV